MPKKMTSVLPVIDRLRVLQLVPEPLPTFRVDVAALFGKYLPRIGIECDLVGKPGGAAAVTGFSRARMASPSGGRLRRECAKL